MKKTLIAVMICSLIGLATWAEDIKGTSLGYGETDFKPPVYIGRTKYYDTILTSRLYDQLGQCQTNNRELVKGQQEMMKLMIEGKKK